MKTPLVWIEKGVNALYSRDYCDKPTERRQSHQIYMHMSVPPSCSPVFQYKYSHFQYFGYIFRIFQ